MLSASDCKLTVCRRNRSPPPAPARPGASPRCETSYCTSGSGSASSRNAPRMSKSPQLILIVPPKIPTFCHLLVRKRLSTTMLRRGPPPPTYDFQSREEANGVTYLDN